MPKFGYLNENNPISIGDLESQEMINVSIDKDFLEFCHFTGDNQEEGRLLYLPNGKEVIIDAEAPQAGLAKWRNRNSDDDFVTFFVMWLQGTYPNVSIQSKPNNNSYFRPSVPCEVFYAVTIYDKQENIESTPFYSHEPVEGVLQNDINFAQSNINNNDVVKITLRRPKNDSRNLSRHEYRIYRIPIGGTEYMLIGKVPFTSVNTLDAYGANYIYNFYDTMQEESLTSGEVMTTEKLVYEPQTTNMNVLALYADKLFIGGEVPVTQNNQNKGILYFSATGEYWRFNASFFFSFVDPVIGLTTFNEMLVVQTTKKIYIIYGDSEDNFVQKEIDFRFDGIAYNSGQALGGHSYFLATPKDTEDKTLVNRVFAFNGSVVSDISQKIIREFEFNFEKTYVIDNRYFVIEKQDGTKLVLDTLRAGWCMANDRQYYFSYRTKEFDSAPKGKNFLKKLFVRGKGAFLVVVLGDDSKIITQKRLYSPKAETHYIYIKPRRFTTFSVRFIGYEDTEIYDWGIAE